MPVVFAGCTLQKDEIYSPDGNVNILSSSKNQLYQTGLNLNNFFYKFDSSGTNKYDDGKLMYQIVYTSPLLFDTEQYENTLVINYTASNLLFRISTWLIVKKLLLI